MSVSCRGGIAPPLRGKHARLARRRLRRVRNKSAPKGMALILAMVCLAVVGILFSTMVAGVRAELQQSRAALSRIQSAWLAESGLERAAAQLAANKTYAGESWQIPAEQIGGTQAAMVRILVRSVPGKPRQRQVVVVADYPGDGPARARVRHEAIVQLTGE